MAIDVVPDIADIQKQYDEAIARSIESSRYPASSYEDGVKATLAWIVGDSDDEPIEFDEET